MNRNEHIVKKVDPESIEDPAFQGYSETNYLVDAVCPRFGTGEGKAVLNESVRGKDLFIMVDVCNHSLTYTVNGYENHKSLGSWASKVIKLLTPIWLNSFNAYAQSKDSLVVLLCCRPS